MSISEKLEIWRLDLRLSLSDGSFRLKALTYIVNETKVTSSFLFTGQFILPEGKKLPSTFLTTKTFAVHTADTG